MHSPYVLSCKMHEIMLFCKLFATDITGQHPTLPSGNDVSWARPGPSQKGIKQCMLQYFPESRPLRSWSRTRC